MSGHFETVRRRAVGIGLHGLVPDAARGRGVRSPSIKMHRVSAGDNPYFVRMMDADDIDDQRTDPSFDARALAADWKLSEQDLSFCLAILGGANQTQAARMAGFPQEGIDLRKKASALAGTKRIKGFLQAARLAGAEVDPEKVMDREARRRLLSRIAAGHDKSAALRAAELLNKMESEDKDARASGDLPDPKDILKEIAAMSPLLGAILSHYSGVGYSYNLPIDISESAASRWHCPACAEKIIQNLKAAQATVPAVLTGDPPFLTNDYTLSKGEATFSGVEIE